MQWRLYFMNPGWKWLISLKFGWWWLLTMRHRLSCDANCVSFYRANVNITASKSFSFRCLIFHRLKYGLMCMHTWLCVRMTYLYITLIITCSAIKKIGFFSFKLNWAATEATNITWNCKKKGKKGKWVWWHISNISKFCHLLL